MRKLFFISFVMASTHLVALAPNQMSIESSNGIQENNLKLGLGWSQENQPAARVDLLQGSLEFFPTDRFSIRGNTAIPLSTAVTDMKYYPIVGGGAFHLLPWYWLDFYLGVDAGFVHIASPNLPASWSTRVTPLVGITIYYWGVFFIEGEVGYNIQQYAKDTAIDFSAPTFRVRMGFYL